MKWLLGKTCTFLGSCYHHTPSSSLLLKWKAEILLFRKQGTIKRYQMKKQTVVVILLVVLSMGLRAQQNKVNYRAQITAFKQSFKDKNLEQLKPYLSPNLVFPVGNRSPEQTERVLLQLFNQLPLISMELKKTSEGSAVIHYNFENLGERTSAVHFNEAGKITKIEVFNNLIEETRTRRQAEIDARPVLDELSKKYRAKKVDFTTADNRKVIGNLYHIGSNKPVILLFHQAGYNKYEYADIAPKLNELGYNCLAVDLTGGGEFAEHKNETVESGRPLELEDIEGRLGNAEGEIAAAIAYVYNSYKTKVILWGSSYSATLALFAGAKEKNVSAVLCFSAFNHFRDARPPLESILPGLKKPFFMTSSKREALRVTEILKDIPLGEHQVHFIPHGEGMHGAKTLWNGRTDAKEYWVAVKDFLKGISSAN